MGISSFLFALSAVQDVLFGELWAIKYQLAFKLLFMIIVMLMPYIFICFYLFISCPTTTVIHI